MSKAINQHDKCLLLHFSGSDITLLQPMSITKLIPGLRDLSYEEIFKECVTHLHETSRMSAEFVFRYGPKCMGGVILPILVLLHL